MTARLVLVPMLLIAAAAVLPAHPAAAQTRSQREDPSVRSAGMGGASTAVIWSDDVNAWANPALLGYASGMQYRWNDTRLLPDLSGDVHFQVDRFSYGWGGLGLAVESHTLSYGQIQLTDPLGTPIGFYEPTETIRPLSGGISLSRTLEAVASLRGGLAPRLARHADVAFGFSRKRVRIRLAPAPYGEAETVANDFGLLVRGTPLSKSDTGRPLIDLTYGFAALNYNDAQIAFGGQDRLDYVLRQYRHGIAARVGVPLPHGAAATLERFVGRWIASGMDPLVSLAVAADFARFQRAQEPYGSGADQVGVEVGIANTLAFRFGHARDEFYGIDGNCFGLGLGLSLADFAGARYDYARQPEERGFGKLRRHAVAAWFDPVALVRR